MASTQAAAAGPGAEAHTARQELTCPPKEEETDKDDDGGPKKFRKSCFEETARVTRRTGVQLRSAPWRVFGACVCWHRDEVGGQAVVGHERD